MRYFGSHSFGVASYAAKQIFLTALDPLEYNDPAWLYRHWYATLAHEIGHLVHHQCLPAPEDTGSFQRKEAWREFAAVHKLAQYLPWKMPPEYFAEAWRLCFTNTGKHIPNKIENAVPMPALKDMREWFFKLPSAELVVSEVAPRAEKGRTLVPVRFVAEALEAKVYYIAASEKVVIEQGNRRVELWLGKNEYRVITW